MTATGSDSVRRPLFARFYDRASGAMEAGGFAAHRARLLAGLSGRVIEVGAGNGLNFPHYPPAVSSVLAVEPEPYLREVARRSAESSPIPIAVVAGVAERLPADDATFDAAVVSLLLCSVAEQAAALRDVRRVVRPGGQLRFLEHVRGQTRALTTVQRLLDATFWPVVCGGCHTSRDTGTAIQQAGFAITDIEHVRFPDSRITLPTSPHIIGTALRH